MEEYHATHLSFLQVPRGSRPACSQSAEMLLALPDHAYKEEEIQQIAADEHARPGAGGRCILGELTLTPE